MASRIIISHQNVQVQYGQALSRWRCKIILPDPDDAIYLGLAITAHAEGIITGNKKHFPEKLCEGIKILSPEYLSSYVIFYCKTLTRSFHRHP